MGIIERINHNSNSRRMNNNRSTCGAILSMNGDSFALVAIVICLFILLCDMIAFHGNFASRVFIGSTDAPNFYRFDKKQHEKTLADLYHDDDYQDEDDESESENNKKERNQTKTDVFSKSNDAFERLKLVNVTDSGQNNFTISEEEDSMKNLTNDFEQTVLISEKRKSNLPYPLSMLQDISYPMQESDMAFFWHVPKAGGSTVKDIVHRCYGLTRAQPMLEKHSLELVEGNFVNLALDSPKHISEAKQMGIMESGLLKFAVSSYLFEMSELFTSNQKGRMFTMLRHPVEMAISLFFYLGKAEWESEYDSNLKNMTLMEFARSDQVRSNWMTRFLTNEMEAPLTDQHVAIATKILAEKCVLGFIDKMEESISRFESYFGWKPVGPNGGKQGLKCLKRFLEKPVNKNEHATYGPDTDEWKLLAIENEYDIRLYEYARNLFDYQGDVLGLT